MARRRRILVALGVGTAAAAAVGALAWWARRQLRAIAEAPDPYGPDDLAPLSGSRSTIIGHDGTPIHVVDAGEGPPVVLVHGFTATNRFWVLTQRPLVERGHRVVAFDQRGHGATGIGSDGSSVEALGADLASVLEGLDLTDAVVVGHSLGGVTVQSLLVHHPDVAAARVRHAVIACSLSHNRPEGPLMAALPGRERAYGGDTPSTIATLLTRATFGVDPPPASLVQLAGDIFADHDPKTLAELAGGLGRFDLRPGLPGIGVAVTIVAAGHDRITPPRYSSELAALLPESDEHWFARAGHMLPWELPEEFVSIVADVAAGP